MLRKFFLASKKRNKIIILLGALILLSLVIVAGKYFQYEVTNPISNLILKNNLKQALILEGNWFVKNQTEKGDLFYQRSVETGNLEEGNHITRQAFSFYTLALAYKNTRNPEFYNALKKGIDYFKSISIKEDKLVNHLKKPTQRIALDQNRNSNTTAFVLLSLIELMETNEDLKPSYYTYATQLADYLVTTQMQSGGFRYRPTGDIEDSYNDGESLYALARMYQISKDPVYLEAAKKGADYLSNKYLSKKLDRAFYSWGMQAFYHVYQIDPQEKYWDFIRKYTEIFMKEEGHNIELYYDQKTAVAPSTSLPVFLEGVNHAAYLAEKKDKKFAESLKRFLKKSLQHQLTFQINGPLSNRKSDFEKVKGGVCNNYYCKSQTIDVVGHNLGAAYFYLKYF